ncbi:MAG: hypothetical protein ACI3ZO_02380 [Candidatus Cryptobacteroides sp.]|nr:hypothetical protein [Bacteroidales bacterium]
MQKIDTRTLMMDAGMTLFETKDNFGLCLGQVKAELSEYGKVLTPKDMEGIEIPESTGEYDFFIDRTTFWRKRYVSCRVEGAGDKEIDGEKVYRYALCLREGNRSTIFRNIVMAAIILLSAGSLFLSHSIIARILSIAVALIAAYSWVMPSWTAAKTIFTIMDTFSGRKQNEK